MTYSEQLQRIVNRYVEAAQPWPATARDIARWAIDAGEWRPQPTDLVNECADQLSRAMREEYIVDPQGRSVRSKHAARRPDENGQQTTFWADIRSATPEHMQVAFQQRRQQIVGDCRQLKADVDSYNDNARPPVALQLILDFTNDVAEIEAAAA
jgi:hypothetical protein